MIAFTVKTRKRDIQASLLAHKLHWKVSFAPGHFTQPFQTRKLTAGPPIESLRFEDVIITII